MIRYVCLFSILAAVAAADQVPPCTDWSDSMPPPRTNPGLLGGTVLHHGDHLLVAGDSLFVCLAAYPELTVIGRCDIPGVDGGLHDGRLREIDGVAYVCARQEGILRIDLSQPTAPVLEVAFATGDDIRDVAACDAALVVATWEGRVHLIDGLGVDQGEIMATIENGNPYLHDSIVAAEGNVAVVGGTRIAAIDVTDPTSPTINSFAASLDLCIDLFYVEILCEGLVLADSIVNVLVDGYLAPFGPSAWALWSIDLHDPASPVELACEFVEPGDLVCRAGDLVFAQRQRLEIRSPLDLSLIESIAHPLERETPGVAIGRDHVYLVNDRDGAAWFHLQPDRVVAPQATIAPGYDPGGGGRFAIASYERRDTFFETTHHTVYFDQSDPLHPIELDHVVAPASEQRKGLSIVAQDDRVAILHSWHEIPDQDERVEEITAMTADGERHSLFIGWWAGAWLAGDIVWILGNGFETPISFEAFKLGSGVPEFLGRTPVTYSRWLAPVGDHLLVDNGDGVAVYDVSDPQEPAYRGFYQDEFAIETPIVIHAGLLISSHAAGIALHELALDSDALIRPRGRLDLASTPTVLDPADHRLAVAAEPGWRLVSLEDPDHPAALCDWIPVTAGSFIWGEQDLYVDTRGAVYRYDLGDPGNPVWAGQSRYASGTADLARRGDHLLNDGQVLPLDCLDVVGVDDPDEPAMPTATSGLLVVPNPFNPRTTVTFTLDRADHVAVTIHDLRGRRVATLADARFDAGDHVLGWIGRDDTGRALPSGAYLVRLRTETAVRTTKAVLVR